MENNKNLPEKWCIKQTPATADVINKWINENCRVSKGGYVTKNSYIHYPATSLRGGFDYGNHCYINIKPGYTEITFEQFQKYVLNKETSINTNYSIF